MRGIGDSLYTPFSGNDGDDIDWDAYRTLGALLRRRTRTPDALVYQRHRGVLVADDRRAKALLEVAIEEGRAADPDVVIQACTAATSAKDCVDLTQHAQQAGADIVYIQTPMMEAHGGEGVLNFFRYIADRTDIALGMFNSPSSGYVLTPAESARIYSEIPAVCATKEGAFRPASSRLLHELAPNLTIWECDLTVYRAGWLRAGIVGPAQLGTAGYLYETPQQPVISEYWELVWNDKLIEAMDYAEKSGLDQFGIDMASWFTCYPGSAGLLHALGRGVQVRGVGARPADRRLPALAPAASRVARGGQGADRCSLSAVWAGLRLTAAAVAEGTTDRCTVCAYIRARTPPSRRSATGDRADDPVLYELRDSGVAVLTLNRPERMNGWGGGLAATFYACSTMPRPIPTSASIVVTGSGRAFCAGADMGDLTSIERGQTPRRDRRQQAGRRTASALRRRRCASRSSPPSTARARASG